MADYKEAYLATRPKTLDPAEYFNLSPDYRRTEEERAALRSRLKRHYLVQLNNPHRKELIVRDRDVPQIIACEDIRSERILLSQGGLMHAPATYTPTSDQLLKHHCWVACLELYPFSSCTLCLRQTGTKGRTR
ncbi:uncharacterized protein LOC127434370 isoform X1 [Myxocyprinus asiaticus]|uniref:uncharacterized protein LOC127434370 isoform X1 n=1 Tax=Myxocyprinus asiaticus TaxID=70543 RepID=UPI0022226809|nr:uncharacterized protein LOC127434370 isoform X1 [Myxocyprinus asiaticus]